MSLDLPSKPRLEAEALVYVRRESLDIYNRLHSIDEDIHFVSQVKDAYRKLALVPNLRCGAWYVDPSSAAEEPAYFKSTDGHYNGWSFNLRRPNLHLLSLAVTRQGIILVDSTRSGKRLPDALSKTVPIWCSVINRVQLIRAQRSNREYDSGTWDTSLYTPPGAVSSQEHSQIEAYLDHWALDLANSSYTLPELPAPLRPFWITPATSTFPFFPKDSEFIPIICVSASKQVHDGVERRSLGFAYVQGSGDDHELWGMGLTPALFWRHKTELLESDRSNLDELVQKIVAQSSNITRGPLSAWKSKPTPILKVQGKVGLCQLNDIADHDRSNSTAESGPLILLHPPSEELPSSSSRILNLSIAAGKKGQHDLLYQILPRALQFATAQWQRDEQHSVVIACQDGKDVSIGVALALLQACFDDDGTLRASASFDGATKKSIRTRLEWIIASRPAANPSRATLKRVNDFILSSTFAPPKHVYKLDSKGE